MNRGQSLVELAICAPVVIVLALGAVALVQVAEARQSLEAATQAAVAAAARAPDAARARTAAGDRFTAMVAGTPLREPALRLDLGAFARGGAITAEANTSVELAWGGLLGLPREVTFTVTARTLVDRWRSRPAPA